MQELLDIISLVNRSLSALKISQNVREPQFKLESAFYMDPS